MKAYVAVTGVIFALVVILHVWRVFVESATLASDPHYIVLTLIAVLLSIWSIIVFRRIPPKS